MEYRKRCNVCGNIFCYTDKDLNKSLASAGLGLLSSIGTMAGALSGNWMAARVNQAQGESESAKIMDFEHCPKCHSTDLSFLTNNESEQINKTPEISVQTKTVEINSNATEESLLKRTKLFLEDEEWDSALAYCEQIMDINPECAMAYVYKLMSELQVREQDKLADLQEPFSQEKSYEKALRYADIELKNELEGYNEKIKNRNNEREYSAAIQEYERASTEKDCLNVIPKFEQIIEYKDSVEMIQKCKEKASLCKYNNAVQLKQKAKTEKDFLNAKREFDSLGDYLDSGALAAECGRNSVEANKNDIYDKATTSANSDNIATLEYAIKDFEKIAGWRDSDQKKIEIKNKIETIRNKEKKNKIKKISIGAICLLCIMALIIVKTTQNKKQAEEKYQAAFTNYQNGNYESAKQLFIELEDYSDATSKARECEQIINYQSAMKLFAKGDYEGTLELLKDAKGDDISKYKEFCDIMIELDSYNANLTDIYNRIGKLGEFENVQELLNTNVFLKKINTIEGTWEAKSAYGTEYSLEIKNAKAYEKSHHDDGKEYSFVCSIFKVGDELYVSNLDGSGKIDAFYLKVDGNKLHYDNQNFKKVR